LPAVINASIVAKAKADARPGAARYEISDARAPGLVLRVGPRGAVWQFRFAVTGSDRRVTLGDIETWSIAEARDIVGRGQQMLRDRTAIPDDDWVERWLTRSGKTTEATMAPVVVEARPRELFLWSLADARQAYLTDRAGALRPVTVADYRAKLEAVEIREHDKTPVARLTRQDMAGVVARIHRSGRETHAQNVVRALTAFWSWLERDEWIGKSGVTPGVMRGLRAPDRSLDNDDDVDVYVPDLAEVARVLAIARSGALHPTIGSAIELCCWTVQRRRTIAEAKADAFQPIGDGEEGLWIIQPAGLKKHRRGGRRRPPHVIPLPAPVWKRIYAQLATVPKETDWLFPQVRARRAGDELAHVSVDTISHTLEFMPGVTTTAHGLRRAFATHGESLLGLLRGDTAAILDHSDTRLITSATAGRTDVTGTHYALHDGTHRTWGIMRSWVAALEPLIEIETVKLPPVKEISAAMAAARRRDDDGLRVAAE